VNGLDLVQQIHPTSVGGEEWYLSTSPMDDPRFNCPDIQGNATDGFTCQVDPALMTVETSVGYNLGSVSKTIDHAFLASVGFMYRSNDWRDCEATGYFDCRQVIDDHARIQIFARGAEVGDERQWCPGSSYMGELNMQGEFRWVKHQYYLSAENQEWIPSNVVGLTDNLVTRSNGWFGFKIVMTNVDIGDGKQGVQLMAYVDKGNNNSWTLIPGSELLDKGGWGQDDEFCGGYSDQIITWGGPLATFRIETGSNVLFNKLSVREIDFGGQFIAPATTAQTAASETGAFQRLLAMSVHRYRIGTSITPTCTGEIPTDPDPPPPNPGDPGGPPGGSVFVEMRYGHRYDIEKVRRTITSVLQMMEDIRARVRDLLTSS
jgi:hypothetical protein